MKGFKPTPTCINRASEFSHTIVELFADKHMIIYKNQSSMNVWLQNSTKATCFSNGLRTGLRTG